MQFINCSSPSFKIAKKSPYCPQICKPQMLMTGVSPKSWLISRQSYCKRNGYIVNFLSFFKAKQHFLLVCFPRDLAPSEKGFTLTRKNLLPGSKFFPFRVNTINKGGKNIFDKVGFLASVFNFLNWAQQKLQMSCLAWMCMQTRSITYQRNPLRFSYPYGCYGLDYSSQWSSELWSLQFNTGACCGHYCDHDFNYSDFSHKIDTSNLWRILL